MRQAERDADPELRRCRRYGCQHEARDHGFVDGEVRCWRCAGDRAWHPFTRTDRTEEDAARERATAERMRKRGRGRGTR